MRKPRRISPAVRAARAERAAGCALLAISAAVLAAPFILCAAYPAAFIRAVWGI